MASLSVRKLDEDTLVRLRIQAAEHGVSMEEEARRILKRGVTAPERLGDLAVRLFSPSYGEDDFVVPDRETSPPPTFE